MGKLIYCLVKDDIKTHVVGYNINISTDLMDVNLTREAAEELISDLTIHLQTISEQENINDKQN